MRAVWLEDGRIRVRDDVPVPEPPPGEARVRVTLAGICNTDLELIRGYYPFTGVLGHEFVGVIEEVAGEGASDPREPEAGGGGGARADAGAASGRASDLVGRRVVGEINTVCGRCRHCREGRPTHCARRTVLGIAERDGAFAEYLTLPVRNLHLVPDAMPDEIAVFTEPLAAALEIQEQVEVRPDDRVLVVGDGKLGQMIARSLALTGCHLTVVGRHERKLALLEKAGIETVEAPAAPADRPWEPGETPDQRALPPEAPLPPGLEPGRFDLAVECTGNLSGFATARAALRPRGTLVLKSTYAGELALDASSLVVDEITLVGSRCGPFEPALELLAEGRMDPRPLIDDRFPLAEAEAALARARARGVLKVLLEP